MKKMTLFIIFIFTMLIIPITTNAKDFNVSIDSVSLEEKSDGTTNLKKETFSNLDLNFNLRFFEVGDYAKYKIVLRNDSDEDYYIKDDDVLDKYLKYGYSFDDNSNKLSANSTKNIYLTITYNNKVSDELLIDNKYSEQSKLSIVILDNGGNIVNPETGSLLSMIMIGLLILCFVCSLLLIRNKKVKAFILLILIAPLTVFALDTLEINLKTDVVLANKPVNMCTYDGELVQGVEYTNGQYTYRYMQKGDYVDLPNHGFSWVDIDQDGWGVMLTDKNSTEPVTTPLCTMINDKPIVAMSAMFTLSNTTSIDLSSFDTSNVTDMSQMFNSSKVTSLDLSGFDTSKVTTMRRMFRGVAVENLDLSSFDTSNVENLSSVFSYLDTSSLDLSNFDTSKVTDMGGLFCMAKVKSINLSSFNTSNVEKMNQMFDGASQLETLDVSNFDTSKVTNMASMFRRTNLKNIDVSNFDTSKVTNMMWMFRDSQFNNLDLSNFNTSKVTNIVAMFNNTPNLKTLDISNFDTSNISVDKMKNVFNSSGLEKVYIKNHDALDKFSSIDFSDSLEFILK